MKSLKKNLSYEDRLQNEIERYKDLEIVHQLPAIQSYWANRYLRIHVNTIGYKNSLDLFYQHLKHRCLTKNKARFCSVGAGNCDMEISLIKRLVDENYTNFIFECIDINQKMLDRGMNNAKKLGLENYIEAKNIDLNSWSVQHKYDSVLAIQCLHHFVDLENIFEKINNFLDDDGYFMTQDMIGRNGHQRWPETLHEINKIWGELPERYKFNHRSKTIETEFINRDFSKQDFEGIRAEDILPLLDETFHFETFIFWGGIIDPFISRAFGHNYDPKNENDIAIIDEIQKLNEDLLLRNKIKPTQMIATMKKNKVERKFFLYGFTPKQCIRKKIH